MTRAYVDSSAFVKLVSLEAESAALRAELLPWPHLASAALLVAEVLRAAAQVSRQTVVDAQALLAGVELIGVDEPLLQLCALVSPPELRTLDAIHLAAALSIRSELGAFFVYDQRLADAARGHGLPVRAPS
ncbi:MAG: type II toxin-antitoxin system VapC family toxin [Candidatus Dormibacteraceae bacterium]